MTIEFWVKAVFTLALAVAICYLGRRLAARLVLGRRHKRNPLPGERWVFRPDSDGSPWPPDSDYLPVTVLEVKDGWVRYDMVLFKNQRLRLDSFTRMYRPISA